VRQVAEREPAAGLTGTLVVIRRYRDLSDAYVAQSWLRSAGVAAELQCEYHIGVNWGVSQALGGVRLTVQRGEAETAMALLEEVEASSDPAAWDCPSCGASQVQRYRLSHRVRALSFLFLYLIPLTYLCFDSRCLACGHRWREC
jgi:predicted RNA-binding Zn-ribbon protein involved in translation (DUF1610 family)